MAGTGLASIVPRGGRSPRGWPVGCRARPLVAAPAANLSRRAGTGPPERADPDPVCLCQLAGAALNPCRFGGCEAQRSCGAWSRLRPASPSGFGPILELTPSDHRVSSGRSTSPMLELLSAGVWDLAVRVGASRLPYYLDVPRKGRP